MVEAFWHNYQANSTTKAALDTPCSGTYLAMVAAQIENAGDAKRLRHFPRSLTKERNHNTKAVYHRLLYLSTENASGAQKPLAFPVPSTRNPTQK